MKCLSRSHRTSHSLGTSPNDRFFEVAGDQLAHVGRIDEWHLNHDKPFRHIAFELGAGFSQVREVPVVSFPSPGLVAIWAVGDAVGGDGVE